jgi:pyridoxamine 5'-phosphate oxidase
LRGEYDRRVALDENTVDPDPVVQFGQWLAEAFETGIANADAAALATAGSDGRPSVRFVLCKGADDRGFAFYTNTESRKALELEQNAEAALAFYWGPLGRQVRLTGVVELVDRDEAAAYFASRPVDSRLSAWASPQSRPLASRAELDRLWEEAAARFPDGNPALPPHWGGYRIVPREVEFWEHRDSRLHDRVHYSRGPAGDWERRRLAP